MIHGHTCLFLHHLSKAQILQRLIHVLNLMHHEQNPTDVSETTGGYIKLSTYTSLCRTAAKTALRLYALSMWISLMSISNSCFGRFLLLSLSNMSFLLIYHVKNHNQMEVWVTFLENIISDKVTEVVFAHSTLLLCDHSIISNNWL